MFFRVRNVGLSLRDVKNGDRTDYVHENKGDGTKCQSKNKAFARKCTGRARIDKNRGDFLEENAEVTR